MTLNGVYPIVRLGALSAERYLVHKLHEAYAARCSASLGFWHFMHPESSTLPFAETRAALTGTGEISASAEVRQAEVDSPLGRLRGFRIRQCRRRGIHHETVLQYIGI